MLANWITRRWKRCVSARIKQPQSTVQALDKSSGLLSNVGRSAIDDQENPVHRDCDLASRAANTSKPTLLAAWRSPTRPISRKRSVHPCANCKKTRRKSDPSTKSHPSNTLRESALAYGLINNARKANPV